MDKRLNMLLLVGLVLAVFLDISSFFMPVSIFTPYILHTSTLSDYSVNARTVMLGVLIGSYGFAQLIGAPIFGDLSDQYGRKKILLTALLVSLFGTVLGGVSLTINNIFLVYISRLLIGMSSGTIAIVFACAVDFSEKDDRAKNIGYVGVGAALGAALGPVIGGHFSSTAGMSWFGYATPFWVMSVLYVINITILYSFLPSDKPKRDRASMHILKGLVNIWVVAKSSLLLRRMIVMGLFFQIGVEGFYLLAPIIAVQWYHLLPNAISNHFFLLGMISAVVSLFLNKYLSKYISSSMLYLLCTFPLILGFLSLFVKNSVVFYLPFIAVGLFGTLCWIHINNMFSQAVDEKKQGLIFGVSQSLWSLGGIIGSSSVALSAIVHDYISIVIPVIFGLLTLVMAFIIVVSKRG